MLARKPFIIAICFVFIVTLIAGILLNFANAGATSVGLPPPHQNHPYINFNDGASTIPAHKDNTLLSVTDVEQYVLTHRSPVGPTFSGGPPKIVIIQLMSSRNASLVMGGDSAGLPDNALVYYVGLRGPFNPIDMLLPIGVHVSSVLLIDEVFDAYTGHRLVWGT